MFPTSKRDTGNDPGFKANLNFYMSHELVVDFQPLVQDTPGPTSYEIKNSLLDDARHKHYGFLEKSKRFRSPTKGLFCGG